MIHPNIQTFPSTAELATAFANWLVEMTAGKASFSIALSGGRTPIYLFDQLVARYSDKIDWQKIKFYWGDERCVPPQHEESNYRSALEHLLAPLNIPAENIFRMHGEADPEQEAQRYAQVLKDTLPNVKAYHNWIWYCWVWVPTDIPLPCFPIAWICCLQRKFASLLHIPIPDKSG